MTPQELFAEILSNILRKSISLYREALDEEGATWLWSEMMKKEQS